MPIHDYKCPRCHAAVADVFHKDDEVVVCPDCCSNMERQISAPRTVIFREGWYDNISEDPIYIKSRKQLKAECKEHDCTSDYAEL